MVGMRISLTAVLFSLVALAGAAHADIKIEARFIEVPANLKVTKADCTNRAFLSTKGVQLLNSPRALTHSGVEARISVGQNMPVPGLEGQPSRMVSTGVELAILPKEEGTKIRFAGCAMIRSPQKGLPVSGFKLAEFSVDELYFSGTCQDGESILLSGRGVENKRQLYLHLTFTKEQE